MSISGIFGKTNLSRIDFTMDLPQEIYAGAPFPLKITLENKRKLLPAFLLRLKTDRFETFFPFVNTRSASSLYAGIAFEKRGYYRINNPYIYSVFPFNFFTRFKGLDRAFNCIVFPALKPCELSSLYQQEKKRKGERLSDKIGYESDLVSIREYVRGDPLKYIHWKATAKTGKLKTKELSSLSHRPIIIDFEKVSIANIEEKISSLAYIIVQLSKKNIPVGLKINGRSYPPDVSPAHKISMLRELALYGTDTEDHDTQRQKPDERRGYLRG